MNQTSFKPLPFDEYQTELVNESHKDSKTNRLPSVDQAYVFTTSRNYLDIPDLTDIKSASKYTAIPDQFAFKKYEINGKKYLRVIARLVPYYRMARSIRKEIRNQTVRNDSAPEGFLSTITEEFSRNVSEFRADSKCNFSGNFPKLYEGFIQYLKKVPIGNTLVEHFEKRLSAITS